MEIPSIPRTGRSTADTVEKRIGAFCNQSATFLIVSRKLIRGKMTKGFFRCRGNGFALFGGYWQRSASKLPHLNPTTANQKRRSRDVA
jgi:hypothetical protein